MEQLKKAIEQADLILVGIGEEFDTGIGSLSRADDYAAVFEEASRKEQAEWLIPYFFSRYLRDNVDEMKRRAYTNLKQLLEDKNYFIVTTCMDGEVWKSLLNKERIVAPCGGYQKLQCSSGCVNNLQDATETVDLVWNASLAKQGFLEHVTKPVCPVCKAAFQFNHIQEDYQEEGYLEQWNQYTKWLQGTLNHNLCVLELGVGLQYPTVIRWPFEKVAFFNQKAQFIRIHHKLYQLSAELSDRGIAIASNALKLLGE